MTRRFGGSGLGLCISKNLSSLMGGDLTFTSELGKGTVFTLSWPLCVQGDSMLHTRKEIKGTAFACRHT